MRHVLFALLPSLVLLSACDKEKDDPVTPAPASSTTCGIAGARLQATFQGAAFCANASLFGDLGTHLTVNGIASNGATLSMELDSLEVGAYEMDGSTNYMIFTSALAMAYETVTPTPATLTIISHDTAANRIQGSFSGPVVEPIGSTSAQISGTFDVTYTE
jgi:hypothetical protein